MKSTTPNLKFWVWLNDGPIRIKLRPGKSLTHYRWNRDEEGWSSQLSTWTHDGDGVIEKYTSDGRDCDGRLTQHGLYRASIANLAVNPLNGIGYLPGFDDKIAFPKWDKLSSSQRDEYAEAMNY